MIGLVGITSNPPTNPCYHNSGWTYVYLSKLQNLFGKDNVKILREDDDWTYYDKIFINEGVNWKPDSWNLMGGVSDAVISRIKKLNDFPGKVFVWGKLVPNYQNLCEKRRIPILFNKHIESVDRLLEVDSLVLGDSHAISVYEEGWDIRRVDYKTLYGFLKENIKSYIPQGIKHLKFYAGNIDIRHHLCRPEAMSIKELVDKLEKQLIYLGINITLVEPLPIEHESRDIPQTGLYKGTPFYGSWEERNEKRLSLANELFRICDKNNWKLQRWPSYFVDEKGMLKFEFMESRRSVHLAPKHYPWRNHGSI